MSKLEQILASNGRAPSIRRKTPGGRARILLLALTALLIAVVFLTQPQVLDAVEPMLGMMPGL